MSLWFYRFVVSALVSLARLSIGRFPGRQSAQCRRVVRAAALALVGLSVAVPTPCVGQTYPEITITIRGAARQSTAPQGEPLGRDAMGLVELAFVPAGSRTATATTAGFSDGSAQVESEFEVAPGTEVPLDPLERDLPTQERDARAPSQRGARGSSRDRDVPTKKELLLRQVPYVVTAAFARDTVHAALEAQGVIATLERLESMSGRAKSSALLPEVRLRGGRDTDQSLRLTPTIEEPYRYSQSGGVSLIVEGAVSWRLGKLIFAGEELGIERLRLAQARERQRVTLLTLNELMAWQTAWRRVQAFGDNADAASEDLVETSVRLDALTAGWFSAHQPTGVAPSTPQPTSEVDLEPSLLPPLRTSSGDEASPRRVQFRSVPQWAAVEGHFDAHPLERAAVSR